MRPVGHAARRARLGCLGHDGTGRAPGRADGRSLEPGQGHLAVMGTTWGLATLTCGFAQNHAQLFAARAGPCS